MHQHHMKSKRLDCFYGIAMTKRLCDWKPFSHLETCHPISVSKWRVMCDVSAGRHPREDLADSLRGRGSPGDWDNHRRKQSNGKA